MISIHLTDEQEQLVRSLIQGGQFVSEDEVIDAALQLLQARDDQARLADLRSEIAIGIAQADREELAPFDPHATLARIRSRQSPATGPA